MFVELQETDLDTVVVNIDSIVYFQWFDDETDEDGGHCEVNLADEQCLEVNLDSYKKLRVAAGLFT